MMKHRLINFLFVAVIIAMTSCGYFAKKGFNSAFKEITIDTLTFHVFTLDDFVGDVTDRTFSGTEIKHSVISKYKIDNVNSSKHYFGTYKFALNDDLNAYLIKIEGANENKILMYIMDQDMKVHQIINMAELKRTSTADYDRNSWISDYSKDGNPDILFRIYEYDYSNIGKYFNSVNSGNTPTAPEFEKDTFRLMEWQENHFNEIKINDSVQKNMKKTYELKFLKIYKSYRNKSF